MGTGYIVSLILSAVIIVLMLFIVIPLERHHIVRENGKINFQKTRIFLRWNRFDTLTLVMAIYTIICVQSLNFLITSGHTVDNPYVQFFTNQSQAWVIIVVCYLISRISITLKSIRAHLGESLDEK